MTTYLLLGLLGGLAVGYAFGWQYGQSVRKTRLDAALNHIRNGIALDRCDGSSEYATGVNAACRNHLALIDTYRPIDCDGGIRCSTCPGKQFCNAGCVLSQRLESRSNI